MLQACVLRCLCAQGIGASGAPFVQRKQALGQRPELRRMLLVASARATAVQDAVSNTNECSPFCLPFYCQ